MTLQVVEAPTILADGLWGSTWCMKYVGRSIHQGACEPSVSKLPRIWSTASYLEVQDTL